MVQIEYLLNDMFTVIWNKISMLDMIDSLPFEIISKSYLICPDILNMLFTFFYLEALWMITQVGSRRHECSGDFCGKLSHFFLEPVLFSPIAEQPQHFPSWALTVFSIALNFTLFELLTNLFMCGVQSVWPIGSIIAITDSWCFHWVSLWDCIYPSLTWT